MATRNVRRVLFRVDSSASIGTGHVVRCLALAEALRRHRMEASFASRALPVAFGDEVANLGYRLVALGQDGAGDVELIGRASAEGATARPFAAVVTDHYGLGAAWLKQVRRLTGRRVVIDDLADRPLPSEVLVNPNLGVSDGQYEHLVPAGCRVVLGVRYAPIRSAFCEVRPTVGRVSPAVRSILVSLGGATPEPFIWAVVDAARSGAPEAHVDVVAGPLSTAQAPDDPGVRVHRAVDALGMAQLMASADLAIGGGGTSSWERCAVGVPTIAMRLASNQDHVVDELAFAGAAVDGGSVEGFDASQLATSIRALAGDADARASMRTKAMALVDGRGAERLAHVIDGVGVRAARRSDAELLWGWANDPDTRAASLRPDAIPFQDHVRWLEGRLSDRSCLLLIGWNGAGSLGQVRFDFGSDAAEVSISVDPNHRGAVGGLLLESAIRRLAHTRPGTPMMARVRHENAASRRLFERAGFHPTAEHDGVLRYDAPAPLRPPAA